MRIDPFRPGWQQRYYRTLLFVEADPTRLQQICQAYVQGLEWVLRYYSGDCVDDRWSYPHLYPPLLVDLLQHVPYFDTTYFPAVIRRPLHPWVQLAYVLPKRTLPTLLPAAVCASLHEDWHSDHCRLVWAYCRYFWEAQVVLPRIDLDALEAAVLPLIGR